MSPAGDLLSMSPSDSFKFPKLTGTNYASWCGDMKSAPQAKYLWLIVTGDEDCPPDPTTGADAAAKSALKKENLEWKLRDQAAQGNIKSACENTQLPYITKSSITTAKEMWDELKKVHETNLSRINVHYLFEELYTRKYADGTSMDDHLAALLNLSHRIIAAGEKFEDLHLARAMVLSLPKTQLWEMIKITLFEVEAKNVTSEFVRTKLQQEDTRRLREKASSETALLANQRSKKGKGKEAKGKGKGAKPDDTCHKCKKKGHWSRDCPDNEAAKDSDKKASGSGSANLAIATLRDLGAREVGRVYAARSVSSRTSDVLLDCGATSHMFYDTKYFTRYIPSSRGETISVGNGESIPVEGHGSVTFKCRLPEGYRLVTLHGVKHVPDLTANLVSLGQLESEGATGTFGGGRFEVSVNGDILFQASLLSANLYRLDLVTHLHDGSAYVTGSSGSLRLWHRRLGHLNLDAVRKLARDNLVDGLTITALQDFDRVCEGCALGKSHRLPFPKASTRVYELMELVVVDLTGPMSVPTWSGMLYGLVVVEPSCRYAIGELLTTKDEADDNLARIITRMERESGKKLRILRSDNGTDFVTNLMEAF